MNFNLILRINLILIILFGLNACTTISKSKCLTDDWQNIGFEVGVKGETDSDSAFTKRQKICSKHGIIADQHQFKSGYKIGLEQYCHIDNALLLGIEGDYKVIDFPVCSQAKSLEYREKFNAGNKLHYLRQSLSETESTIYRINSDISSYQLDRKIILNKLNSNETDYSKKNTLRTKIRQINYEINLLRHEAYYNQKVAYQQQQAADEYEFFLKEAYPNSFLYSYRPPKLLAN